MARWQFIGGSGREFPLYQLDVVPGDVVDCSVCPDAVFFRQTGNTTPVTASLTFPASVTTVDGAVLNVRGARQPSTAYAVNDAVCHDGQVWRCVVAYTSSGSDYFAPAQAVHWTRATITNTPPGNGTSVQSVNGRKVDSSGNVPVLTHANVALSSGAPVLSRLGHPRSGNAGNNGFQDGTNIYTVAQLCHVVAQDCCDLSALFGNFAAFETTDPPNSIIVSAALYTGSNPVPHLTISQGTRQVHPFYFGGQREVTIPANGLVKTDPIGVELYRTSTTTTQGASAAGDAFFSSNGFIAPNSVVILDPGGANQETVRVADTSSSSVGVFGSGYYNYVNPTTPLTKAHTAGTTVSYPTVVFIRTRVRLASVGQMWPAGQSADGGYFDGVKYGTTLESTDSTITPDTAGGTFTFGFDDGTHVFHPLAVMGSTGGRKTRSVAMVGDSRITSQDSWLALALSKAGLPTINVGKGSELAAHWNDMTRRRRRMALLDGCTDVITQHLINDLGTSTVSGPAQLAIQQKLVVNWRALALRGMRVWQTTCEPQSTSTDSWATTTNQTTTAANPARVAINNWIRGGAPLDPTTLAPVAVGTTGALLAGASGHPLSGYLEVADLVESARDSGKWAAGGLTSDGLHPKAATHTAMSASLNLSVLTS